MTLHVAASGNGPPLVLIHGWLFSGAVWQSITAELNQQFRVHCLDLPGYGSNVDSVCEPYDMEQLVAAISPLVPDDSLLVGWSLGAMIAMQLAINEPERLRGLVLISATPRFTTAPDWIHGTPPQQLSDFINSVQTDYAGTIKRFVNTQTKGVPQAAVTLRFLHRILAAEPQPAPASLIGGLHLLQTLDYRAELGRIIVPTLAVHGREDSVIPVAAGEHLARHIGESRWQCFSDCGHVPFLIQPRLVAQTIKEFSDGIR